MKSAFALYSIFLSKILCAVCLLIGLSLPLIVCYVNSLESIGECLSDRQIAAMSQGAPVLWLSGYYDSGWFHKTGVAVHLKPTVAVLGSSRVMQFRAQMFGRVPAQGFYNLGGSCKSMYDAYIHLNRLIEKGARPELLILGIDWWWFQEKRPEASRAGTGFTEGWIGKLRGLSAVSRLEAWRTQLHIHGFYRLRTFVLDRVQLIQNAWRDGRYYAAILNGEAYKPTTPPPPIAT